MINMDCTYVLNKNLFSKNATSLVYSLNELKTSVFLYKDYGRRINGRSLIGVLS